MQLVQLDQEEHRVLRDQSGLRVLQVRQDQQVPQETLVTWDLQVIQVRQDREEHKVLKDQLVQREIQVL